MDEIIKEIKVWHLYTTSIVLFFIAVIFSLLRVGELYTNLFDYGADARTAILFNFLVFMSGIIAIIACIQFCRRNFHKFGMVRTIVLLAATSSFGFIGLFPLGVSLNIIDIHHIFVFILFVGMPVSMFAFATLFYKNNQNLFLILSGLGLLDLIQLIVFYNSKQIQIWQLLSLILILIFHYILLQYSSQLSEIKNEFEDFQ